MYQSVFKASPRPTLIIKHERADYYIYDINDVATGLYGNKLAGKNLSHIFREDTVSTGKKKLFDVLQRASATGTEQKLESIYVEIPSEKAQGYKKRYLDCTVKPVLLDQDQSYLLLETEDVTENLPEKAYAFARIGNWDFNLINSSLSWSSVIKEMHEVNPDYEPDLESAINFYEEGWSRDTIRKAVEDAIHLNKSFDVQLKIITARGKEKWIRSVGRPEFEGGRCVRILGCAQDITSQKQYEIQLKEALEERKNILERITDGFFALDIHRNVVYWSKQAEVILGYPREQILGGYFWDYFQSEKAFITLREHERALKEQVPVSYEEFYSPLNKWFEVRAFPSEEGLSVFFRDITEEKITEDRVNQANERLKTAQKIAKIGYWKYDVISRELYWSDEVYRIWGLDKESFKPDLEKFARSLHPEDRDSVIKRFNQALRNSREYKNEFRILLPDGSMKWIRDEGKLKKDDENNIIAIEGICQDITELKRLQQLNEETAELVKVGSWEIELKDGKQGQVYWSEMTRKILEVDSQFQSNLNDGYDFFESESKTTLQNAVERAITKGEPYDLELKLTSYKGSEKWIRSIGNPEIVDGKCLRLYGSFQDITEKKQLELSLIERIKEQQCLYNITVLDEQSLTVEELLNQAAVIIPAGFKHPESIAASIEWQNQQFTTSNFRETPVWVSAKSRRFTDPPLIVSVYNLDSEREVHSEPFLNEEHHLIEAINHQLSIKVEKILQKRELEEKKQFMEITLENLPIGIAVQNMSDGKLLLMNRSFSEIYGWPKDEIKDVKTFFEKVYPDKKYREQVKKRVLEDIESGDPERMEWKGGEITTQTGDKKIVNAKNIPLFEQGEMISTVWDITAEVESEKKRVRILESISDAFYAIDADWNFTYFNSEAANILGEKASEVIGKNIWSVFPEAKETELDKIYQRVLNNNQSETFEYYYPPIKTWFTVSAYPADGGLSIFFRDITDEKERDERLKASLKEKEIMLAEIHHRVKNNLAVISSMIQLQAYTAAEMGSGLQSKLLDSVARIKTIADIHEQLYQTESFSDMDLSKHLKKLISTISQTINSDVTIDFSYHCERIMLELKQAVPFFLIVNEVITNIFKHAFKNRSAGNVEIYLEEDDENITLQIVDDGSGFTKQANNETGSLGVNIINALTQQLSGENSYNSDDTGTRFSLWFKKKENTERFKHQSLAG